MVSLISFILEIPFTNSFISAGGLEVVFVTYIYTCHRTSVFMESQETGSRASVPLFYGFIIAGGLEVVFVTYKYTCHLMSVSSESFFFLSCGYINLYDFISNCTVELVFAFYKCIYCFFKNIVCIFEF
jgi:hypothetical protein